MTQKLIGIEILPNNQVEIFYQDETNSILTLKKTFWRWFISPEPCSHLSVRLDGGGHFKYINLFETQKMLWSAYSRWERPFYLHNEKEAALVLLQSTYYNGLNPEDLSVLGVDIETNSLKMDAESKVLLISNTLKSGGKITRRLFAYDDFESQGDMLRSWCEWVRKVDPTNIVLHNGFNFDLPYLSHCAKLSGVPLSLGRNGSELEFDSFESFFRKDGSQSTPYREARIYGREIIDTLFLAIKSDVARKYPSYGLKAIIKAEGLEKKDRQHYDASQIQRLYQIPAEWKKIKAYAEHDADDALALYDLLIPPYFYLARSIPRPLQRIINTASGSQINLYLASKYIGIRHSLPKASEPKEYEGAISIGNPGVYRNVLKFDVASLYPNIMRHFKVYDSKKDPKGFFLQMVEELTLERLRNKSLLKETKDPKYKSLSEAQKIIINSCYGFLGAPKLNFNSPENAAFVTESGRKVLWKAIEWCKTKGFALVNADTDSIAFCKQDYAEFDAVEREDLLRAINSEFPSLIQFEDDGYFDSVLVIAAKNYVMRRNGKLTIKGSALKATNKEPALKECLKRMLSELLDGGDPDLSSIEQDYVSEIEGLTDIKRWAAKRSITTKVLEAKRTQELNILNAIQGTDYRQGDKVYVYYKADGTLGLVEDWKNDHCTKRLKKKLRETIKIINDRSVR